MRLSRPLRPFALLAALLLLTLGACAIPDLQETDITSASRDFAQRLRWLDLNGAARHLSEEHRDAFLELFRADKELRLTDVRIAAIDLQGDKATVSLEMEYYRFPSLTVKVLSFEQGWSFKPASRQEPAVWLITTPFPPVP